MRNVTKNTEGLGFRQTAECILDFSLIFVLIMLIISFIFKFLVVQWDRVWEGQITNRGVCPMTAGRRRLPQEISSNILGTTKVQAAINQQSTVDVTKHRTVRTGAKYRSWILVKCVWCGAYY